MLNKDAWYLKKELFPFYSFLLFVLSFPNFNLWPLAWLCFVPLLFFLDQEEHWLKIILLPTLAYAIPVAYIFYGFKNFAVMDFVLFAIIMIMLIMPVMVAMKYCMHKSKALHPEIRVAFLVLVIPSIWVMLELFRTTNEFFRTTSAMILGYSQVYNVPVLQLASIFGMFGISFLILAVNVALFASLQASIKRNNRIVIVPALVGVLLITSIVFGLLRVEQYIETTKYFKVGALQTNVFLDEFWDAEKRKENKIKMVQTLATMIREAAGKGAKLIVLPERSFPGVFLGVFSEEDDPYVKQLKDIARELNVSIIIGALYEPQDRELYNASFFISPKGDIPLMYSKMVLFPFGEYIPGADYFEKLIKSYGLQKRFPMLFPDEQRPLSILDSLNIDRLTEGVRQTIFYVPKVVYPFATPICVEDAIPELCREFVANGAQFLAVMTNDAWFHKTPVVENHFICSIMRAVENNVSIVRAANTGITSIIDPYGRVIEKVKDTKGKQNSVRGMIVRSIPIMDSKSFYNQSGHLFTELCKVLALFLLFFAMIWYISSISPNNP